MQRNQTILLLIFSAAMIASCQGGIAVPTSIKSGTFSQNEITSTTTVPTSVSTKVPKIFTPTSTSASTLEPSLNPSQTATQIPTLTSTLSPQSFDPSKAITRTPLVPAICPQSNSNVKPVFGDTQSLVFPNLEKPILDYLNSGGTWETLLTTLDMQTSAKEYSFKGDLTGDSVPELVVGYKSLFVFGCKDGKYITLLKIPMAEIATPHTPRIVEVADMNLDGIKELIVQNQVLTGFTGSTYLAQIFEWDGIQFDSLVNSPMQDYMCMGYAWPDSHTVCMVNADFSIEDIDGNGTKELVLSGDISYAADYYLLGPFRTATQVYAWNGDAFVFLTSYFSAPEYRYQAVQDGDRATLKGNYPDALDLYQQAIFSDKLDWWSLSRKQYYLDLNINRYQNITSPAPDPNEYYSLAAYARYRIMLLHLLRNYESEAEIVYNTLQEKFPEGQVGHSYAEMAKSFWDEYQTSTNISSACSKAVEYAAAHPNDILYFLGSDYHGWQDIVYKPEDVCPFK